MIDRHPEIFEGHVITMDGVTPTIKNSSESKKGNQSLTCVNERGLYISMARIGINQLSNPDAKKYVLAFQKFLPDLIQKFRKGHLVERTNLVLSDETTQYFEQQMHLAKHGIGNEFNGFQTKWKESVVPLIKQYIFDYGYDM